MPTIYAKVSDEMKALIDRLAEERHALKSEIVRDLLEKGSETLVEKSLDKKQTLSEAEEVEIQIPVELHKRLEGMRQRFHYNDISSLLEGLAISDLCLLRRQFQHGA